MISYYVGLDVSKATVDVGFLPANYPQFQVSNDLEGFTRLITCLNELEVGRVLLEATGGYERALYCEQSHPNVNFLSCLHGSEHHGRRGDRAAAFLSCLHGSEPQRRRYDPAQEFLSCLHGSEQVVAVAAQGVEFLSCLHGSELQGGFRGGWRVISELPTRQ
jgi:hypothetical protein